MPYGTGRGRAARAGPPTAACQDQAQRPVRPLPPRHAVAADGRAGGQAEAEVVARSVGLSVLRPHGVALWNASTTSATGIGASARPRATSGSKVTWRLSSDAR